MLSYSINLHCIQYTNHPCDWNESLPLDIESIIPSVKFYLHHSLHESESQESHARSLETTDQC